MELLETNSSMHNSSRQAGVMVAFMVRVGGWLTTATGRNNRLILGAAHNKAHAGDATALSIVCNVWAMGGFARSQKLVGWRP